MTRRQTAKQPRAVRPRGAPGVQIGELAARAMVLQGAARVFAKMGVRAVSVETLLAASGISRRTFYRLYQSKEHVMIALYELGTDELLRACQLAVEQERDPLRQIERCIDAHLKNARDRGRLVFVLGGEAQHQESALHARRMQVHDELVDMLTASAARHFSGGVDPLLVRALLLALESVTRIVLAEGNEGRRVSEVALARARRVMLRISTAALVGQGAGVTALPRH